LLKILIFKQKKRASSFAFKTKMKNSPLCNFTSEGVYSLAIASEWSEMTSDFMTWYPMKKIKVLVCGELLAVYL
jgi:hypothetical protein